LFINLKKCECPIKHTATIIQLIILYPITAHILCIFEYLWVVVFYFVDLIHEETRLTLCLDTFEMHVYNRSSTYARLEELFGLERKIFPNQNKDEDKGKKKDKRNTNDNTET
jgi:hypothetical protein